MVSNQTCNHILTRGNNKGKRCPFNSSIGNEFCCRHKSKKKCSICMEGIKKTGNCVLECGHEFHLECVFELYRQLQNFSNKCPLCRKEYTRQNDPIVRYTHERIYIYVGGGEVPDLEEDGEVPELEELPSPQPLVRQQADQNVAIAPIHIPSPILQRPDAPSNNNNRPFEFLARLFENNN